MTNALHHEPAKADRDRQNPFPITVRTLAGHNWHENVEPQTTIYELTREAVQHFVAKGELADGDYALTLPRSGNEAALDPTLTVRDVGIVKHDVLVLVSRAPQVDG